MSHLSAATTLAEVERSHILRTLRICEGNRTQTAKVLAVSLRCLRNKLRHYKANGHQIPEGKAGQQGHALGINPASVEPLRQDPFSAKRPNQSQFEFIYFLLEFGTWQVLLDRPARRR